MNASLSVPPASGAGLLCPSCGTVLIKHTRNLYECRQCTKGWPVSMLQIPAQKPLDAPVREDSGKRREICGVTFPYPPQANNRLAVVNGHITKTKEAKDYISEAKDIARSAYPQPFSVPVVVTMDVYRPRRVGDLDNLFKNLFDALTGVAYTDDELIVEIHARRFDDRRNPRVEIWIEEVQAVLREVESEREE